MCVIEINFMIYYLTFENFVYSFKLLNHIKQMWSFCEYSKKKTQYITFRDPTSKLILK